MSVQNLIVLFFSAFLVQNIVLSQFLGLCSFFGVGNKRSSSIGMGASVTFVICVSSIITWTIYTYALVPAKLEYLSTISFILVISGIVQFLELFIKKYIPTLYSSLGIYLPLITTNCAVLGVSLLNISSVNNFSFISMLVFSIATPLGYAFVIYIFSTIREQLEKSPINKNLQGTPIALITAFVMAMAFSGFVDTFVVG